MKESGERFGEGESEAGYDLVAPLASTLIESLRAFSYELPTAIADLVDNSVTAGATHVWVDFHWAGGASVIAITDDGGGMSEAELVAAMRPGSQNPLTERQPHDLGRFGLGLKTASFSQCRSLTVRSRRERGFDVERRWDLDHVASVNEWQLLRSHEPASAPFFRRLDSLPSGTTVVWCQLDRLVGGCTTEDARSQQHFLHRAEQVRQHLAVVFHQLTTGRRPLTILINNNVIEPWDPYLRDEPATQQLPVTQLRLRGLPVDVQPFVLPHHSKLSPEQFKAASGPRGWNAHQGFYVYRRGRLLVPGDWLGLGWAKEEHYKLARIRVEIPTAMDHDWAIDVTKSRALPPAELREELRAIGERTRSAAKRVYTYRGAKVTTSDASRVLMWQLVSKHDRVSYKLNRDHPLLARALSTSNDRGALDALLRVVEETVPVAQIAIQSSEKPTGFIGPFDATPDPQIREVMLQALKALIASGYSRAQAVEHLATLWPFELHPALLQAVSEMITDG